MAGRDFRRGAPRNRDAEGGARGRDKSGGQGKSRGRLNLGRLAAAKALLAVEQGAHVDDVLPDLLPESDADRALAWHLALGVLRRQATLDAALKPRLSRPLVKLDAGVRVALRLGAFEVLLSRTAEHAAVHQAVEAVRALGLKRAAGFVNAVLREVAFPTNLSRAESLDHPPWLVSRWDARYGPDAAAAWCKANAEPPPLVLAARGAVDALAQALDGVGISTRPPRVRDGQVDGLLRVQGRVGRVDQLPGFADGAFWVQDAASAWMTDLVPLGARTVLDTCAAPGGKTFRLAARGHHVTSTDASAARLERLQEGLARLSLPADVREHNWLTPSDLGRFDAVLVDAPCSALGTVRRRPEVRWRREAEELRRNARTQLQILTHAAQHVAEGGALVYVVCSAEPEEGPDVIADFLRAHPGWVVDLSRSTAPPADDEDAFWGARLVRT